MHTKGLQSNHRQFVDLFIGLCTALGIGHLHKLLQLRLETFLINV